MNRGKLGKAEKIFLSVVVTGLIITNGIAASKLAEIPKLNKRVDELNQKIEARDTKLKDLQTDYRSLEIELENSRDNGRSLDKKLQEQKQQEKDLRKQLETQKQETQRYKEEAASVVGHNFEVTYYNDYNYTKSGRFVKDGVTVAVDPNVISLGSWLELTFPDGSKMVRRADDTGGAVKGRVIDVYSSASDSTLLRKGRVHGVKVKLIN